MTETVLLADVPQQAADVAIRKFSAVAGWKKVQQGVLKAKTPADADSFVGDQVLNVPSIIAQHSTPAAAPVPALPRLAIMIHGVHNLPRQAESSSSSSSRLRVYAKAAVHLPGHLPHSSSKVKTQRARVVHQGAVWNSLVSLSPQQPQQMMLSISLKHKQLLTNRSVVWGVATLPLSEVLAAPSRWGERQQLQLTGHRLAGAAATLEVQLFLSTERISGPLSVLAATWNVGNALPAPVEQLREQWLRGTAASRHHLVVVGAQECNYTKDARTSRKRNNRQERTPSRSTSNDGAAAPAVAVAAEGQAAANTGADSESDTALTAFPDAASIPAYGAPGNSTASVFGTSKATTTLRSQAEPFGFSAGQSIAAAGIVQDSDDADNYGATGLGTAGSASGAAAVPVVVLQHGMPAVSDCADGGDGALPPTAAVAAAAAADTGDAGDVRRAVAAQSKAAQLRSYLYEQVDSAASWERHISAALGSKYWLLQSKHMYQTRILLFARVDVVPYISHIRTAFEATGIGHVGFNKGGVAVSCKLDDTHLAFVSSHLAAHQSKTAQRNSDVGEICANLKLLPPGQRQSAHKPDLATAFHHLVWLGDLNYRLEYGQQAITHSDSPTQEDFTSLCAAISAGQYPQLLQLDQLRLEQAAGRVFAGFGEGQIDFAPTFKVLKGEPGCSYGPKRSPAWCDRVLVKSVLPHKRGSCSSYFAAPDICTSDHKPVAAVLSLPLITNTVASSRASAGTSFKLYVASVKLDGQSTWRRLADLAARPGQSPPAAAAAAAGAGGAAGAGALEAEVVVAPQQCKHKVLKLQLVLSGACIAGKHQHFLRVDSEAVASGLAAVGASTRPLPANAAAAVAASLTPREENLPLLPGAATDLQDDWLLLQLVLVDGIKQRTLARGIVPLQPVVAEYTARSFKAVQVPVQLECNSAAAGSAIISLQLISSYCARQGMYEAIRRMHMLAMSRNITSHPVAEVWQGAGGAGSSGGSSLLGRTMSSTLLRLKEGVSRMTAARRPGSPDIP